MESVRLVFCRLESCNIAPVRLAPCKSILLRSALPKSVYGSIFVAAATGITTITTITITQTGRGFIPYEYHRSVY